MTKCGGNINLLLILIGKPVIGDTESVQKGLFCESATEKSMGSAEFCFYKYRKTIFNKDSVSEDTVLYPNSCNFEFSSVLFQNL